jgi:hypothetical protein
MKTGLLRWGSAAISMSHLERVNVSTNNSLRLVKRIGLLSIYCSDYGNGIVA